MVRSVPLPDLFRRPGYDPRFSHDKFGLVVGREDSDTESLESLLKQSGADEVDIKDGL